jgi:hypothetical protein
MKILGGGNCAMIAIGKAVIRICSVGIRRVTPTSSGALMMTASER